MKQDAWFSYISPEARVPLDPPPRSLLQRVDHILKEMSGRLGHVLMENRKGLRVGSVVTRAGE